MIDHQFEIIKLEIRKQVGPIRSLGLYLDPQPGFRCLCEQYLIWSGRQTLGRQTEGIEADPDHSRGSHHVQLS